ncbi:MAG: DUF1330 domain-containing protein [Alphaproteobacteria bacterium]|jgi:uncharacterized protein (DUF1330 family)|nr:DUF1330 domain-containing protein [Alphaproteobacteria bacterium]
MALGYLIAQIDVHDLDAYSKYTAQTPGIAADYGGKFIVRAGQCEALEGPAPGPRVVMIEFPSYARAKEFYYSDEYQAIVGIRHGASTGSAFVVEGAD